MGVRSGWKVEIQHVQYIWELVLHIAMESRLASRQGLHIQVLVGKIQSPLRVAILMSLTRIFQQLLLDSTEHRIPYSVSGSSLCPNRSMGKGAHGPGVFCGQEPV